MSKDPAQFYDALAKDYSQIYADWPASVRRQGSIIKDVISNVCDKEINTVLDASCGIGTQAIGLAIEGYKVHATDISSQEIEQATQNAKDMDANLTFGMADFRDLENQVQGMFDAVVSFDNSITHMHTEEDLLKALRSMGQKLNPDGLLLLSVRNYDEILQAKPSSTPIDIMDTPEGRRIYFQTWDWREDEPVYDLNFFIMNNMSGEWSMKQAETTYRAWDKESILQKVNEVGLTDIKWLSSEETGYYQPIIAARSGQSE